MLLGSSAACGIELGEWRMVAEELKDRVTVKAVRREWRHPLTPTKSVTNHGVLQYVAQLLPAFWGATNLLLNVVENKEAVAKPGLQLVTVAVKGGGLSALLSQAASLHRA